MNDDVDVFARRYATAWSSQNPEQVASFFAADGSLSINDDEPAVGRSDITNVVRGFMTAFPDMVVEMDRLVRKSDVVEFHWTLTGTNTGPDGTGKCVRMSGYEEWRIGSDGLIAESKGHFETAEYERQLKHGVNPA